MRYIREITNQHGRSAQAFEDKIMEVDVSQRLVTLTSRDGNLTVRAQFTREEMAQVIAIVQHEQRCMLQLQRFEQRAPGVASFLRAIARPFL